MWLKNTSENGGTPPTVALVIPGSAGRESSPTNKTPGREQTPLRRTWCSYGTSSYPFAGVDPNLAQKSIRAGSGSIVYITRNALGIGVHGLSMCNHNMIQMYMCFSRGHKCLTGVVPPPPACNIITHIYQVQRSHFSAFHARDLCSIFFFTLSRLSPIVCLELFAVRGVRGGGGGLQTALHLSQGTHDLATDN